MGRVTASEIAFRYFRGSVPKRYLETEIGVKIFSIIKLFELALGFEYGDVLHLPYSGGVMEQPAKTLEVWKIARSVYIKKLSADNKKEMAKMKSGRR
ncbi:hypothetical protein DRQ25_08925 [Candidatus Fermentibacteria bacterium]|nr:MAG: hypothetical protein DRQ25_08925 [Candidatus Fermentibacteria bacterium]